MSTDPWIELPDAERRRAIASLAAHRALGGGFGRPSGVDVLAVAHWITTGQPVYFDTECRRAHVDEIVDAEIQPMEPTKRTPGAWCWKVPGSEGNWMVSAYDGTRPGTEAGISLIPPEDNVWGVPDPQAVIWALQAAQQYVNEGGTP